MLRLKLNHVSKRGPGISGQQHGCWYSGSLYFHVISYRTTNRMGNPCIPWRSFSPWPFRPKVYCCITFPCRHDNLTQIWAGFTKFSQIIQPEIPSAGIENKGRWPWPSTSFWPFWLRLRLKQCLLSINTVTVPKRWRDNNVVPYFIVHTPPNCQYSRILMHGDFR